MAQNQRFDNTLVVNDAIASEDIACSPAYRVPCVVTYPSAIKRTFDIICSAILLFLGMPFFVIIIALLKLLSPGPAIFKQERIGLEGRRFFMYKFRTMVEDAEDMLEDLKILNPAGPFMIKIPHDPRVIGRFAKFLRKSGIDELPQLWNVFRGQMSLVGPRPLPLPEGVSLYYDEQARQRYGVPPGISGLWQITHRHSLDYQDLIRCDMSYIKRRSMLLDLTILAKTLPAIIKDFT